MEHAPGILTLIVDSSNVIFVWHNKEYCDDCYYDQFVRVDDDTHNADCALYNTATKLVHAYKSIKKGPYWENVFEKAVEALGCLVLERPHSNFRQQVILHEQVK